MDRDARLQDIRAKEASRQNKWLAERQAEIDREKVVAELRANNSGSAASMFHSQHGSYSTGGTMHATQPAQPSYPLPSSEGIGMQPNSRQSQQQQQQLGWSGTIRPEAVIDKLTERIADRLRTELKLEMQKESQNLQQRVMHENQHMDDYLARELETQNTCPVCYDLMVPPDHAPQLLFPCGHTFCSSCIDTHIDRHKKSTCPICRKQIDSRAPNYSLQQLILNFVNKKTQMQAPAQSPSGSVHAVERDWSARGLEDANGGLERLRQRSDRIQIRLTVLMNELTDTIDEHQAMEGRAASARLVLEHMRHQEEEVMRRMQALQAELDLLRGQSTAQHHKLQQAEEEAAVALSRRQMLSDTIEPLQAELKKLDILMTGVLETEQS